MCTVRARLQAGEELTLSYLGGDGSNRKSRHAALSDRFGFVCTCAVCSLRGSEQTESDERRVRVAALVKQADHENEVVRKLLLARPPPATAATDGRTSKHASSRLLEERSQLMAAEGMPLCWAHESMFGAVKRSVQCGDETGARRWAKMAMQCVGDGHGHDSASFKVYSSFAAMGDIRIMKMMVNMMEQGDGS